MTDPQPRRPPSHGLDAYVNQTYRSLRSLRDDRPELGHLDAAESVPYALEALFALHRAGCGRTTSTCGGSWNGTEAARQAGHDRVVDAWGADPELLRRA